MPESPENSLPPALRDHLRRELDPGEPLRWCAQPDARRAFHRVLPQAIALALLGCGFGGIMLLVAYSHWQDLHGMEPLVNPARPRPDSGAFWSCVVLGAGASLGGFAALASPWFEAARTRRTVYALTPTRILTMRLSRKGLPRLEAVEPGHPLHLVRQAHFDGRGDVHVYPHSAGPRANHSLWGIPDPREVERLIRVTFDPPGTPSPQMS